MLSELLDLRKVFKWIFSYSESWFHQRNLTQDADDVDIYREIVLVKYVIVINIFYIFKRFLYNNKTYYFIKNRALFEDKFQNLDFSFWKETLHKTYSRCLCPLELYKTHVLLYLKLKHQTTLQSFSLLWAFMLNVDQDLRIPAGVIEKK